MIRIKSVLFLISLVLLFPGTSLAGIRFFSTRSPQPAGSSIALFENSQFRFSSEGKQASFHLSARTVEPWEGHQWEASSSVLDHAYFGYRSELLRSDISLGRFQLNDGPIGAWMDGAYSRTGFTDRTGLLLFWGTPVGSESILRGGRLSHRFGKRYAAGVSYLDESAGPQTLREEAAFDFRLNPVNRLSLSGRSRFDLGTGHWSEHSYSAKVGPFRKATFSLDASQMDTGAAAGGRESAAYLVSRGAGILYAVSKRLTAGFDLRKTDDSAAGASLSEGIRLSYASLRTWNAGISAAHREGEDQDILDMNAFLTKRAGNLETSLNLQKIIPDGDVSSKSDYTSAVLGFVYQFNPAYRLAADLQAISSGHARTDYRAFLKLEFRFQS